MIFKSIDNKNKVKKSPFGARCDNYLIFSKIMYNNNNKNKKKKKKKYCMAYENRTLNTTFTRGLQ